MTNPTTHSLSKRAMKNEGDTNNTTLEMVDGSVGKPPASGYCDWLYKSARAISIRVLALYNYGAEKRASLHNRQIKYVGYGCESIAQ